MGSFSKKFKKAFKFDLSDLISGWLGGASYSDVVDIASSSFNTGYKERKKSKYKHKQKKKDYAFLRGMAEDNKKESNNTTKAEQLRRRRRENENAFAGSLGVNMGLYKESTVFPQLKLFRDSQDTSLPFNNNNLKKKLG